MNDLPLDDGVRARMQGIRCDIDQGLEEMSASARSMVDWKHYVKTYPWVCLGTAAAVGFVIVPKRDPAVHARLATPAEVAKGGQQVIHSAPLARGWVDSLIGSLASLALREGTAYLGRSAGRLLGTTSPLGTNDHDSNSTS
jgi:hypothetical protein